MRVVLVAEEGAGIQALRLLAREHELAAVYAAEHRTGAQVATVASAAREAGVRVLPPADLATPDGADRLRSLGVDLLLNVHGLHVLSADVLAAPRLGAFNLHPGPLPEYAGLNAPSWATLNAERCHGVTIHWMTPEIDAGPVAYAATFPLGADVTGLSVSLECARLGQGLIAELVATASRDPSAVPARAQDLRRRRYFGPEVPYHGRMPWTERARRLEAFTRACDYGPFPSPWGRPRTHVRDREVRILRAKASREDSRAAPGTVVGFDDRAALVAAEDALLRVDRIEVDGTPTEPVAILRPGDRLD